MLSRFCRRGDSPSSVPDHRLTSAYRDPLLSRGRFTRDKKAARLEPWQDKASPKSRCSTLMGLAHRRAQGIESRTIGVLSDPADRLAQKPLAGLSICGIEHVFRQENSACMKLDLGPGKIMSHPPKALPGKAHMLGRLRQTIDGQAKLAKMFQHLPRLHTIKAKILIAWIIGPCDRLRCEPVPQQSPAEIQKRSHPTQSALARHFRYTGKAIHPGPARKTHQNGFSLIVLGMPQQNERDLMIDRPIADQPPSGITCLCLQIALPVPSPAQNVMRRLKTRGRLRHQSDLVLCFGSETVIHSHRLEGDWPAPRPVRRQMKERHGI